MKQYIVVKDFSDIQDDKHIYLTGDVFPREGLEVSEERVAELASKANVRGEVLIKVVEDKNVEAVDNSDNEVIEDKNDEVKNENDVVESEKPKKNGKKKEK